MSTVEIPLSRGRVALVDAEDAAMVAVHRWHAAPRKKKWYAATKIGEKTVYMHRLLLGLHDRYVFVDHMDGDGLNNLRKNIRSCTPTENTRNRITRRESGMPRGVWPAGKKYAARLVVDGEPVYLGRFETPELAGAAYIAAAQKLFGAFAPRINP